MRPVAPKARLLRFRMGDSQYAVLSYDTAPRATTELTSAEREVLAGLVEGLSNADIAKRRRTSVRTVANQVASLFKKLDVGSRAELVARLQER